MEVICNNDDCDNCSADNLCMLDTIEINDAGICTNEELSSE